MTDHISGYRRIQAAIVLVLMGEGTSQLGFHSGIGPLTIGGIRYEGAGDLLSVSEITNRSGLETTTFSVSLSRSSIDMQREALKADLRDEPIRVSLLLRKGDQLLEEKVIRLKQGRISNVSVSAGAINAECYTPMTDLTRVRNIATRLTMDHQRNYVDGTDTCLDHVSDTASREISWP